MHVNREILKLKRKYDYLDPIYGISFVSKSLKKVGKIWAALNSQFSPENEL